MKFIDLTGKKFNQLTVIRRENSTPGSRKTNWICKCDCGKETTVSGGNIKNGHTKSCGCYRVSWHSTSGRHFKKHGLHDTPLYQVWTSMHSRIRRAKIGKKDHYYAKNKIKICERWNKLENFIEDMKDTWFEGGQIDRIDNEGNYEPNNCKWSTRKEQMNNTHNNVKITLRGRTQNAVQWAEELKMSAETIRGRIRLGWSGEKALTTPIKKHKKNDIIKRNKIK
jgi:hypothetical protein